MPYVKPFHGVRYNTERVAPQAVIAPPYDIVSDDHRARLAQDAQNVVHLELPLDDGGEGTRYQLARERLRSWLQSGVLARDDTPRLYPYVQRFRHNGGWVERRAVFGLIELTKPGSENRLHPHEFTLSGPREDRFRLLQATRTSLSPIFLMHRDPSGTTGELLERATRERPLAEAETGWETEEALWSLDGEEAGRLAGILSESRLVFADGHHRYESALRYAEGQGNGTNGAGHRFALAAFVEQSDPGLVVQPTHRVVLRNPSLDVQRLRQVTDEFFTVEPLPPHSHEEGLTRTAMGWLDEQRRLGRTSLVQILSCAEAPRGVTLKEERRGELFGPGDNTDARLRELEVVVLQALLEKGLGLGPRQIAEQGALSYTRDAATAWASVHRGDEAAFLVSPTPVEKVVELASAGLRMPQKTTYFHPKLSSGWLFHLHDPGEQGVAEGNGRPHSPH
jgi:uncharacterized protein (DUF1015 family)